MSRGAPALARAALAFFLACSALAAASREVAPSTAVPGIGDHTLLSWREGPPYGTNAPYSAERRFLRLETGNYAAEFDTEQITIAGFGRWRQPREAAAAAANALAAAPLPAARWHLVVRVGGTVFTCAGRRPIVLDRHGLPAAPLDFPVRVIESGRFFQKFTLHDLEFRDPTGRQLPASARLELAAWPDSLSLTLVLRPEERLTAAGVFLRLETTGGMDASFAEPPADWEAGRDHQATLPVGADGAVLAPTAPDGVVIQAVPIDPRGQARVEWRPEDHCHQVRLEAAAWPDPPEGIYPESMLAAWEAYEVTIENQAAEPRRVALNFDHVPPKAITGFVPMFLDARNQPVGLPLQVSKNWHLARPETELPHAGAWIHSRAWLHLEPHARLALRHGTTFAQWGAAPTASLAQLSLVGWGHNGFWEELALGSFGETLCFQPGRSMRRALLTDFRPRWQRGCARDERWAWPANLGGGDTMVRHDAQGQYVPFRRQVTRHVSSGPNLAHLAYEEMAVDDAVRSRVEVLLPQSDELARVYLKIRHEVRRRVEFTRLVLFQLGADLYNDCAAPAIAWGTAAGLGAEYRPDATHAVLPRWEAAGEAPWISLHGQTRSDADRSGQGSRGLVVREWRATLGGRPVPAPWFAASRGLSARAPLGGKIIPPPGLARLEPGDTVEMLLVLLALPLAADRYYGPDDAFRAALDRDANTWRLVWREAAANRPAVELPDGARVRGFPPTLVVEPERECSFVLRGGLGLVPVRLRGLPRPDAVALALAAPAGNGTAGAGGTPLEYWQSDYDVATRRWTLTYSLPAGRPATTYLVRAAPAARLESTQVQPAAAR